MRTGDRWELAVLVLDAVLLAVLEMFFLPLRFDGTVLPRLGDIPAPFSVLLAVVTMPLLVRRAQALGAAPLVAGAPLFGWLLAIGVLIVLSPGGDLLLVPDWRSLLLIGGGAVAAILVLGRASAPAEPAGGRRG